MRKLSPREIRFKRRVRRISKRLLPVLLSIRRRREYKCAIAAKRKRPSRRARHLERLAERDARLAEFAANRPEILP